MKVTAYERDASWWSRPNTSDPKKLHRPADAPLGGMAACNSTHIMLVTETPHEVDASSPALCRRCFPVLRTG